MLSQRLVVGRDVVYTYWISKRNRPWFWTFDFGKDWNNEERFQQIFEFVYKMCKEFNVIFAGGGLSKDWFDKHDVIDPISGKFTCNAGASFDPGVGLPGIYWFNYFSLDLINFFGDEKKEQIQPYIVNQKNKDGLCFLTYNHPNEQNSFWRRQKENQIVEILGKEYFFDLVNASKKRPLKKSPIPNITDATSLHK